MEVMRQRAGALLQWIALILLITAVGAEQKAEAQLPTPTPPSAVTFTDITKAAGINFVHFKGNNGISINREEFGPGVCVADFDGDGWTDIYFVNGRDLYSRGITVRNALYHNNRDGTFTDVTEKAGVPGTGYGLGCVWGDYDNDGFPDLFVTQYGRNVLYHNNRDGTFTDVTDKAGVGGLESGIFHSGATFFDYDRDGYLDLYVGSYVALLQHRERAQQLSAECLSRQPERSLSQQWRRDLHQRHPRHEHSSAQWKESLRRSGRLRQRRLARSVCGQ
jgi:hypothetical protein